MVLRQLVMDLKKKQKKQIMTWKVVDMKAMKGLVE